MRFGIGAYSDFGLSANFGSQWAGRYYVNRESLITMKVNPSIAGSTGNSRTGPVGAGFSFAVARLTFKSQINNLLPRVGDGSMSFESWDEAFGGNVGILVTPVSKLRMGLTYQSPEFFKFGFRPFFKNLGPGLSAISKRIGGTQVSIPVEQPQQVMVSALYKVLPQWSLMGNVGWQNWSAFGEFPVGISAVNQNIDCTPSIFRQRRRRGQQLRSRKVALVGKGSARQFKLSETNRISFLPIDRQLRYGTGIQYQIYRDITAGAAWEFMDAGPGPFSTRRGPLAGTLWRPFNELFELRGVRAVI